MNCNDGVSTSKNRDVKFQLRMTEELRYEFSIAAELRGANMSSLLHQYIVKVIREEKQQNPEAFNRQVEAEIRKQDIMVAEKIDLKLNAPATKTKAKV